jgi:hypothetical protein
MGKGPNLCFKVYLSMKCGNKVSKNKVDGGQLLKSFI